MTLGSLFDGSGGFPLGGMLAGIEPIWASEIEPFPILVTHRRFPCVRHYGDILNLSGAELPPVDIITFGSPCQDLSVAGTRAGIHDGERSSLFFQAIRIIREMREATNGKYPRYCVWENVPGAFSSNGGDDFKAVLETVIGVKEEEVQVPAPDNHRWPKADIYLGDGFSVAYRVLDAQYWGVPQRRARIFLVADFGGERAGVLFKFKGLYGDSEEGRKARKTVTENFDRGPGKTDIICLNDQGGAYMDVSVNVSGTLRAQECGHQPIVLEPGGTIRHLTPTEYAALQGFPDWWCDDLAIPDPTEEELAFWMNVWNTWQEINGKKPKTEKQIRKWLANPHTDTAEYKMWGNGVALPCVAYVMRGIADG